MGVEKILVTRVLVYCAWYIVYGHVLRYMSDTTYENTNSVPTILGGIGIQKLFEKNATPN